MVRVGSERWGARRVKIGSRPASVTSGSQRQWGATVLFRFLIISSLDLHVRCEVREGGLSMWVEGGWGAACCGTSTAAYSHMGSKHALREKVELAGSFWAACV